MLAHRVNGQNFGPNEGQGRPLLLGAALEQLQDVGENADRKCGQHGPGAKVNKAGKQFKSANSVDLKSFIDFFLFFSDLKGF